jgi:hypothetical protein
VSRSSVVHTQMSSFLISLPSPGKRHTNRNMQLLTPLYCVMRRDGHREVSFATESPLVCSCSKVTAYWNSNTSLSFFVDSHRTQSTVDRTRRLTLIHKLYTHSCQVSAGFVSSYTYHYTLWVNTVSQPRGTSQDTQYIQHWIHVPLSYDVGNHPSESTAHTTIVYTGHQRG